MSETLILVLAVFASVIAACVILACILITSNPSESSGSNGSGGGWTGSTTGLGMSGSAPPIVSWQGKMAFKVEYKGGEIHPSGTNCNMSFNPPGVFPASQVRVRFRLWIADNFPWTTTPSHNVAGKLGGLKIGSGSASGGNYSTTGASFRLTFKDDGMANAYLYPQLRQASSGNDDLPWSTLDQSASLRNVSTVHTGISVWRVNDTLRLKKQQWNSVEMFCRLNTPGKFDGLMELVINDKKLSLDTVRYRYDAGTLITSYSLGTFFGGGDKSYAPPSTTNAYFADYAFSAS
jgi:hypothetical protein